MFQLGISRQKKAPDLLFANISLETPANLFEREFNSSSTTVANSEGAVVTSVVVFTSQLRPCYQGLVGEHTEVVERRFMVGFDDELIGDILTNRPTSNYIGNAFWRYCN